MQKPNKISSIIGIILLFLIVCTVVGSCMNCSGDRDGFTQEMTENLKLYGSTIDHYSVDGSYVGVYVDTKLWNNSPTDLQQTFIKEICGFTRVAAVNHKIKYVTVAIYTADREQIGIYNIEGN